MKERNRLNFKEVKAAAPGVKSPKKRIIFINSACQYPPE